MTKTNMTVCTASALVLAMVSTPSLAQEQQPAADAPTNGQAVTDQAAAQKPLFADAKPVQEAGLAKIAGREDLAQVTQSEQTNAVTGNSVGDNANTGMISLQDNAFRDMNGFTIVNANTGNNVAINATIQVNIALPGQ
jgi:uncharacterized iron-regulated membrane protein